MTRRDWVDAYLGRRRQDHCARCGEVVARRGERSRQLVRIEFGWPALWSDMAEMGLNPETGEPIGEAA